jgi:hypothetical protein
MTCLLALVLGVSLPGCNAPADDTSESNDSDAGSHDGDHEHGDHDHDGEHGDHEHGDHEHDADAAGGDEGADTSKIEANLAKLTDEEQILVKRQDGLCLVGGSKLGSMGKPFKITVEETDFLLCCEGCRDAIEEDPQKYIAMLKKDE